jgi:sarcosine oxidase
MREMTTGTDVGLVGAGIAGLSTAYALLERGASVTVYERGVPGNGQSGGESRIFRHAHDDRRLVALACEARAIWRDWEERFGRELLSRDGVVALGPLAQRRLAVLEAVGGVRARAIDGAELAERLPALAPCGSFAMLDEDGGVVRARAAIEMLAGALREQLVLDEVLSVRATAAGTVEVRAGGRTVEHDRVVVCAGRGTTALARGAGLALPVRPSAHARLTFRVRGEPPVRLACLQDGSGAFGEAGAYGDALPGNAAYAVGLGETPAGADGGVDSPDGLAAMAGRTAAYVARALPGLDPTPCGVRHCWVTQLPWASDAFAVWQLGGLLVLAGNNLFKHAPAIGRALTGAALGEVLPAWMRPEAELGAEAASAPR